MWINIALLLYAVHIFPRECCGVDFLELPGFQSEAEIRKKRPVYPKVKEHDASSHPDDVIEKKPAYDDNNKLSPYHEKRIPMYPKYKTHDEKFKRNEEYKMTTSAGQRRAPMYPKYKRARGDLSQRNEDYIKVTTNRGKKREPMFPKHERANDYLRNRNKGNNKVTAYSGQKRKPMYPKYENDNESPNGDDKVDDRRYWLVSDDPNAPPQPTTTPHKTTAHTTTPHTTTPHTTTPHTTTPHTTTTEHTTTTPLSTTTPDPKDPDAMLKAKIATLLDQSLYDTEQKIKSIQYIKDQYRDIPSYKVGFIVVMVKKCRDMMNELFNIAVKHRDDWTAMEEMKTYEMIVHTNVDTTNLVRQLVEIHIQNVNATKQGEMMKKRRVVVL